MGSACCLLPPDSTRRSAPTPRATSIRGRSSRQPSAWTRLARSSPEPGLPAADPGPRSRLIRTGYEREATLRRPPGARVPTQGLCSSRGDAEFCHQRGRAETAGTSCGELCDASRCEARPRLVGLLGGRLEQLGGRGLWGLFVTRLNDVRATRRSHTARLVGANALAAGSGAAGEDLLAAGLAFGFPGGAATLIERHGVPLLGLGCLGGHVSLIGHGLG